MRLASGLSERAHLAAESPGQKPTARTLAVVAPSVWPEPALRAQYHLDTSQLGMASPPPFAHSVDSTSRRDHANANADANGAQGHAGRPAWTRGPRSVVRLSKCCLTFDEDEKDEGSKERRDREGLVGRMMEPVA